MAAVKTVPDPAARPTSAPVCRFQVDRSMQNSLRGTHMNVTGRPGCAALPRALHTKQPTISMACVGLRAFTEIGDDRSLATIPVPPWPDLSTTRHKQSIRIGPVRVTHR